MLRSNSKQQNSIISTSTSTSTAAAGKTKSSPTTVAISHHPPCVLVHCLKGRSRSATVVLAYLIFCNGWSVAEAMRYILARRPSIEPNLSFIEALRQLQASMEVSERSKKCSHQSLLIRNIVTSSSVLSIRHYL
uniref:protein-tyrosine-phosphatase n=1 Tax=Lygus hesperus TaxID=30085 RepID=A0A0A9Z338_LYGHE